MIQEQLKKNVHHRYFSSISDYIPTLSWNYVSLISVFQLESYRFVFKLLVPGQVSCACKDTQR